MANVNEKNNTRGFTLIELLAVIVVLAIVMLIAVNSVIPRMESARKQAFAIEANGLVEAAQAYILTKTLTTTIGANTCVTVSDLVTNGYSELDGRDPAKDKYTGKVNIQRNTDPNTKIVYYTYTVWLENDQYMINGVDADDAIVEADVVDFATGTFSATCS
ncbi:MAG: type II secretion system protein [Firmicutes bacterium]|nr:type II secretion system protein [Bacillota bacterium]